VPEGTLEDLPSVPEPDCLTILLQALDALAYLHNRDEPMVHRDIKPSNILIKSRNPLHIKLADFGLANIGWELNTACGTPQYVAPEVYNGKYDSAVDIWSLGVVIFRFANGGLPRYGTGWHRRLARSVQSASSKSALIKFLSKAMISSNPILRFTAVMCSHNAKGLSTVKHENAFDGEQGLTAFEKHIPIAESSKFLPGTVVQTVTSLGAEQKY
jgi:serine/threonine protein kinase